QRAERQRPLPLPLHDALPICGIAGEIRQKGEPADIAAVARMNDAQARRGPDAQGIRAQGPVAFGHRRLRVIDTSDAAEQPMVDPDRKSTRLNSSHVKSAYAVF